MDEHHTHPDREVDELDQSARAIANQRSRAREFAAAQRQELDRLDAEITGQLDHIREELRREHTGAADRRAELAEQADLVRRQTEEVAAKSAELAALESELDARRRHLDEAHEQAQREQESRLRECDAQREEIDARSRELDARGNDLQQRVDAHEQQCAAREAEIEQQRLHLETVEAKLHHEHRALEVRQQEHLADVEETARLRKRTEDRLAALEHDRVELEAERARTKAQRERIAREFKEQRDAQIQEIERRRQEMETLAQGERSDLEQALSTAQHERQQLDAQLAAQSERLAAEAAARETALEELAKAHKDLERLAREGAEQREQRDGDAARLAAALARIEELEAEHATLMECSQEVQDRLTAASETAARVGDLESKCEAQAAELTQMRDREAKNAATLPQQAEAALREREALVARLADAETRLAESERKLLEMQAAPQNSAELADLKRRHEMLIEDLRELKRRNLELEKKKTVSGSPAGSPHGVGMDWEAQKSRMLAALEADDDKDDETRRDERLRIEEAIRATDAALAEKNTEIEELQRLLAHQSDNLGSVAVGAAAFGEMLDKDAIVCQERERLKQLQSEWEDKLRQAEVELSVQRAQIARARVELDERQRTIDSDATSRADERDSQTSDAKGKKPPRGRWLSRLGLKDDGEA
jgi:chromosome segregation ATPase